MRQMISLALCGLLVGCFQSAAVKGEQGDVGPEGEKGNPGEQGLQGEPADPTADSDEDTWVDWVELAAGTDPNDPESVPDDLNEDLVADVFQGPSADLAADSDGDGWEDWIEMSTDSDPYDPVSLPDDADGDGVADKFFWPLPYVEDGGGLSGTGAPSEPLAVSFGTSGTQSVAARSDHEHDDTYVAQSSSEWTTLAGGGNADALHTHLSLGQQEWFDCGVLDDLQDDCDYLTDDVELQEQNISWLTHEFGVAFDTKAPVSLTCTTGDAQSTSQGVRLANKEPYFVEVSNPVGLGMRRGGALFYRVSETGDSCEFDSDGDWSYRSWYLAESVDSEVKVLVGDAQFCIGAELPLYCRKL